MPALEMAQETGKLISWLKKEGDAIRKGEPLPEIETDKVVVELEAPADGVLAGVKAAAGDVVPVGQTIAWIVAPGEQPPVNGIRGSRCANDDGAIEAGRGAGCSAGCPHRAPGSEGIAQGAPHGQGTRRRSVARFEERAPAERSAAKMSEAAAQGRFRAFTCGTSARSAPSRG